MNPTSTKRRRGLFDRSREAQLEARVARYLREGALRGLGYGDYRTVSRNPGRLLLRAESARGGIALKFFDRSSAGLAKASDRMHRRLPRHRAPECLYRDLSWGSLRSFGLVCLGWRWMEGRNLEWERAEDVEALMVLLAEMNAEGLPAEAIDLDVPRRAALIEEPTLREVVDARFRAMARMAGRGEGAAPARIQARLDLAASRLYAHGAKLYLSQRDLHSGNFVRLPEGGLQAVDFDLLRYAPFELQLATALEHVHTRGGISMILSTPVAARRDGAAWDQAAAPYFAALPAERRRQWEANRVDALLLAFVSLVGQLLGNMAKEERRQPLKTPRSGEAAREAMGRLEEWSAM